MRRTMAGDDNGWRRVESTLIKPYTVIGNLYGLSNPVGFWVLLERKLGFEPERLEMGFSGFLDVPAPSQLPQGGRLQTVKKVPWDWKAHFRCWNESWAFVSEGWNKKSWALRF